jgi:LPXTG-motif cell wall-anchored protein
MTLLAPAAMASPSDQHGGNPTAACNGTHHSDSGHGANRRGAYDQTCDGSPSGNGNGKGQASGKPCAGCVGNADDKNPPGQAPNGSDHNAGYECDRNHGVGRTNPAHTGCRVQSSSPPPADGSNGTGGNGKKKTPPRVDPKPPVVENRIVPNVAAEPPAPPAAPVVELPRTPTAVGTAVLGVSLVRPTPGGELARVAPAVQAVDASELPRTGSEGGPDLLMAGLGLVVLGSALRRAGRLRR